MPNHLFLDICIRISRGLHPYALVVSDVQRTKAARLSIALRRSERHFIKQFKKKSPHHFLWFHHNFIWYSYISDRTILVLSFYSILSCQRCNVDRGWLWMRVLILPSALLLISPLNRLLESVRRPTRPDQDRAHSIK